MHEGVGEGTIRFLSLNREASEGEATARRGRCNSYLCGGHGWGGVGEVVRGKAVGYRKYFPNASKRSL